MEKKNLWDRLFDGVDAALNPVCDVLKKAEEAIQKEIDKKPNE